MRPQSGSRCVGALAGHRRETSRRGRLRGREKCAHGTAASKHKSRARPRMAVADGVAGPGKAGQLLQSETTYSEKEANGRSWATQLIDAIGCPLGAKPVDLAGFLRHRICRANARAGAGQPESHKADRAALRTSPVECFSKRLLCRLDNRGI